MNSRNKLPLVALLALGLLLTLGACSGGSEKASEAPAEQPAATQQAAAPVDPATAATISGTVKYTGQVPRPARIDMSQDPSCKGENMVHLIAAENGNLANAFVYVKEGLGNRTFPTPQEHVVIDQKGCQYHPAVLGVMAGQTVEIRNSDPTTHNVHPTPRENREWNESQAPNAAALEKTFAREEIMMQVKCNQHPWMKMNVNVLRHPFFAVTDSSGNFEIKGLPPGEYTVAVVHDRLGEQTQKITVAPKESKATEFSYGAGGAAKASM
ncbi:MAG: carboxypeptidase regulatory-like domain-containing protein [Candidatus Korobacteraceae bacterium]